MTDPTTDADRARRTAWEALDTHHDDIAEVHLRDLFAADPDRADRMSMQACGLHFDYSKNRATAETMSLLVRLADACGLHQRIEAMFAGAHINVSEDRAALHVALRLPPTASLIVDGVDVVHQVHEVLDRMGTFAEAVRSGTWRGFTGETIRNVVNIGIGGSDLGPAMANQALAHYRAGHITSRFVSNVDPTEFVEATRDLDPRETMFVVCSKTFTTLETLTNARAARDWVVSALGVEAVSRHFVAVSTNAAGVSEFGIDEMFEFWDWVGGRYSMDSAIGLSTMIAIGPDRFREMLAGLHDMDEHFRTAPLEENLPVLMGLLAVWYRNFFGAQTHGVMPYSHALARFPAYLQQLTMESNGKHVTLDGDPVPHDTGPIYWGEPGTNGQHSFFQLLHQGTTIVPVDLIGFAVPLDPVGDQHDLLMSNLFAQAHALAFGRTADEIRADGVTDGVAHRVMHGNRPTSVLLSETLTPYRLGTLIALYEHNVFTQGAIWAIDSFDQWGVELGKEIANQIAPQLCADDDPDLDQDPSTNALIRQYRSLKRR